MSSIKEKSSIVQLEHSKSASTPSEVLTPPTLSPTEEAKVWRKIDIRLMPMFALLYLFAFLDRANIGLAKIQGLTQQLELTGNRYNIALTMFFITYILFEVPSTLVLKKFRPSRWLPGITTLWGIVMMSMGFVKTHQQLVGVRVCLGLAEAGLFPGVIYCLTLWYPRHKLQYRIALFFGAATVSGAFSGILAYGISFMSGIGGKLGWSWIFIIEGCATIGVGILAFFVMEDFPATAKFLTPEEKKYVIWRQKYDTSRIGEEEQFEFRHIIMAVSDWQVWLLVLLNASVVGQVYGISFFLPTIINGFGYSPAVSSLLTVPPFAVATILLLTFAYFSDGLRIRWPFILAGLLISSIGFAINISNASDGVKYFGTFLCVSGAHSASPGTVAWLSGNVSGEYKRAVAISLQIGVSNIAGIIAANIYRSKDAPHYRLGHGVELGFIGLGLLLLPIVVYTYSRINTERGAEIGGLRYTDEELRSMGDKAPTFPYWI
jgi:sugar phosphate permease